MDILNLIIGLISGAAGGNAAGAAMPDKSLGILGNTLAGLVGGGMGSSLLHTLGFLATTAQQGGLDMGSLVANVASGGVGGAVVMVLVALLKGFFNKT